MRGAVARGLATLPRYKLVPMPRLSPSMSSGRLLQWHIQERAPLPENGSEVLFEVEAQGLLDEEPGGTHHMLIEAHEEGFLAKILVGPGESAEPDEPVAIVVENQDDCAAFSGEIAGLESRVPAATFAWQAYLHSGAVSCSNS